MGPAADPSLLRHMRAGEEILWKNENADTGRIGPYTAADVQDAAERLLRFAPLIMRLFPETAAAGGLIESPLTRIPAMAQAFPSLGGPLFLKRDSDLAVAGSVKARGGVYEVLKHTEALALSAGLLNGTGDDYTKLDSETARAFFAERQMQVGSTGNLGISIGIMSAVLGYRATVHMSADAKQWKKDLLRSKGVTVLEYEGDYECAVNAGRTRAAQDETCYFVDDENSADLFLGYAVAAGRLQAQLAALGIPVDEARPLNVFIPCGVGGAPGGVTYGLKLLFGKNVRCWFAEPVNAPCVTLGLMTGLYNNICVQEIGLSGKTQADGLAVGRPSGLVCRAVHNLVSGCGTVSDERLPVYQRRLWQTEGLFIEPSSAAAFRLLESAGTDGTNIVWATGGSLVPAAVRKTMLEA